MLDAKGKILRAKIKLGNFKKGCPFFASLLSHMDIKEFSKEEEEAMIKANGGATMGVSPKGDLYYSAKWVEKLNEEELKGVLCHETLHLALSHLFRKGNRERQIWNIAGDIIINYILKENNFELPKEGIIPNGDEVVLKGILKGKDLVIKDLGKKNSEVIYDEIYRVAPKTETYVIGFGKEGNGKVGTFDIHIYGEESDKAKKSNSQSEKEWKKRLVEASTLSKLQGNTPKGMERIINDLVNNKVNWKTILRKYITSEIVSDYTWARPSKRSIALGEYLPRSLKENVEIAVAVDTSGSIGQEELTQFVSEIVHIVKSTNNLKACIMDCDTEIGNVLEITNGNIQKVLKWKVKGGGGTSFNEPIKYILKNKKTTKLLIYLTDGYGDVKYKKSDLTFDILWVLTKDSSEEQIKNSGKVIKME